MKRITHAAVVLMGLWLLLSGHFTALLIALGAFSAIGVSLFSSRLGNIHQHSVDLAFYWRLFQYLPWLGKEIVTANIDVTRRIWSLNIPLSPSIIRVPASQKSDLGIAIHANSITLTPGTLSLEILDDAIEVHCIAEEVGEQLIASEMNARAKKLESHR